VRETCEIAIEAIKSNNNRKSEDFESIDPTPSFNDEKQKKKKFEKEELKKIFLDKNESLYKRYKAMFSLRNLALKDVDAALILCEGFKMDEGALFKHEVVIILIT
jgi:deoxyhypusine monooxygenase